ncbi:transglutaminaseTgpA domain-containing protein [Isoptericola jiangsuensis]|uniref:transglutaminase family protein n=1 Tax=Isoptericola jiangsuensis TaxID=548579 RepID=UPI003AAB9637
MIPAHAGPVARLLATSLLVAVAVAGSFLALTALVIPGPWVTEGLVGIALVCATLCLVRGLVEARARRRGHDVTGSSLLPTLAGAVVAAWFVLARYGAATSDPDLLVGPSHVVRAVARLGQAADTIRSEVAPVPGTLPIVLVAVGGTLAVLLLADALAGGLHRPALAGLPLLALWAPPLVLVGGVPRGVFLVVVAALLLLLTVPPPRHAPSTSPPLAVKRAERSRAALTTASAVVLALGAGFVASASSSLPSYAGAWYQAFTTSGDAIQLAEDLDVLGSLTERSSEVVLTYTGPEDDVGPLRTYTASAFDGRHWQRGDERAGEPFDDDDLLWPDDVSRRDLSASQELIVSVGSLREDQLPLPVDPRTVTVSGTWGYDPVRDEVVGDRSEQGTTYRLGVRARSLEPDRLREAAPGTAEDAYLEVPRTDHAADIADIAADVVGDAPSAYDQAVALQRWLRDPGAFTYSTELPRGGTGDPVWDFLQHRTGYCVQFATTMTVMARTLGIPARLGVGFLPGDRVDPATGDQPVWQVTGQDSHAWPELYFEGVGWVRFEPTPAVQTGPPPQHTDPRSGSAAVPAAPQEAPTADTRDPDEPQETAEPSPSEAPVGRVAPLEDEQSWPWIVVVSALVLVAGGAWFLLARGRRRDTGPLDAEQAWQQVVSALAEGGVELPPPTTPRQAPASVLDALATSLPGREPSDRLRSGLTTLAAAVEESRYVPAEDVRESEDLAQVADDVVAELAALRSGKARRADGDQH